MPITFENVLAYNPSSTVSQKTTRNARYFQNVKDMGLLH